MSSVARCGAWHSAQLESSGVNPTMETIRQHPASPTLIVASGAARAIRSSTSDTVSYRWGLPSSPANRSANSAIVDAAVNRPTSCASSLRERVISNPARLCSSRFGLTYSCAEPSAKRSSADP